MVDLTEAIARCGSVERDRLTAAELCIDECLTILDRHGVEGHDPMYQRLSSLSAALHQAQFEADGPEKRMERLRRMQTVLTTAMPMTDADLSTLPH